MYILIDVLIVEGSPWRSAGAHNFITLTIISVTYYSYVNKTSNWFYTYLLAVPQVTLALN